MGGGDYDYDWKAPISQPEGTGDILHDQPGPRENNMAKIAQNATEN